MYIYKYICIRTNMLKHIHIHIHTTYMYVEVTPQSQAQYRHLPGPWFKFRQAADLRTEELAEGEEKSPGRVRIGDLLSHVLGILYPKEPRLSRPRHTTRPIKDD